MRRRMASELRNSDKTTSAPIARQICRNGASDTPAMGARSSGIPGSLKYGNRMPESYLSAQATATDQARRADFDSDERAAYPFRPMQLREFFDPTAIALPLKTAVPDEVLPALVALLNLEERDSTALLRILRRREELGSTGVGRGIAIPHGRSGVVSRVRLAYAYSPEGVPWRAVDDLPVHHFFLIIAPPIEVSNQYLPILGRIATFAKDPDVTDRLSRLSSPDEFFKLLDEKGV